MTHKQLTAQDIADLSFQLTLLSAPRALDKADLQQKKIAMALLWHRDACRPLRLTQRLVHALLSRRLSPCLALIEQQKAMLRLAASEDPTDHWSVLEALGTLSTALTQFTLGPGATPKQLLAFAACEMPEVRARFGQLVRNGEIASTPDGLTLSTATRRQVVNYVLFGALVAWPAALFIVMTLQGGLTLPQLLGYLVGTIGIALYLTSGMFKELRSDKQVVSDLNAQLKPRAVGRTQMPE